MPAPNRQSGPSNRDSNARIAAALAALLTLCGVARIVATYPVFSQTWDEPAHIATGLEWLDRGTYTLEPLHPPLARVMTAIGPYMIGERSSNDPNLWSEGNRILGAGLHYDRVLTLARAGILPFFVLASACVFLLGRRLGGGRVAVVAVLLFTTLPPVLAHAGLATTDMAVAAAVAAAMCALLSWAEAPTVSRGLLLGVAIGGAIACKFSALLYLPLTLALTWLLLCVQASRAPGLGKRPSAMANSGRPIVLAVLLTLWAAYRFSIGPIIPANAGPACPSHTPDCQPPALARIAVSALQANVYPAPEFFKGLMTLASSAQEGRKGYLLGERSRKGWWLFFPVAIALKTPLPFLVLTALGMGALVIYGDGHVGWLRAAPVCAAMGMLLVCMPSRITIGLRHVLPIYPLLSVTAAQGALLLWRYRRAWIGPGALGLCLAWQVLSGTLSHPDYLAYFNELARGEPEQYLVDSDLDWGQDLKRLAFFVRGKGIRRLKLAYHGSADPQAVGLDNYTALAPYERTSGWVAVSVYALKLGSAPRQATDDYLWLEAFPPVVRVGRSIIVYWFSDSEATRPEGPADRRSPREPDR